MITAHPAKFDDVSSIAINTKIIEETSGESWNTSYACILSALRTKWQQCRLVSGFVDGKNAAVYGTLPSGLMHFAVLPEYRKYSAKILHKCRKQLPDAVRCVIPSDLKHVVMFARRSGFKVIGNNGNKLILEAGYYGLHK